MSVSAPDIASTGVKTYNLDPAHSSVGFSVRHLMIAHVRGSFSGLSGTLKYDPSDKKTASVEIEIDAATLSTGVADRDTHVKSADFLDVANHPKLRFTSTKIDADAGEGGEITGNLTIKTNSRPVTLIVDEESPEVKDPWGNYRVAFSAHAKIKRSDYGITWNAPLEAGGLTIGDEMKVNIEVQFVRRP